MDHRLWMLLSPALPVGGYSYSQGLERAVADGWVPDLAAARRWILGIARELLPYVDLAALLRMSRAARDGSSAALEHWNAWLLANRESAELRREDREMGAALGRLLGALGLREAAELLPDRPSFAAAFAVAGAAWRTEERQLCAAYAWVWAENQVAAAVKLVPLGQSDGQRLLLELNDGLDELVDRAAECDDSALGRTLTGLGLASAAHEVQSARLFRS